jgi:hypothetical protein
MTAAPATPLGTLISPRTARRSTPSQRTPPPSGSGQATGSALPGGSEVTTSAWLGIEHSVRCSGTTRMTGGPSCSDGEVRPAGGRAASRQGRIRAVVGMLV